MRTPDYAPRRQPLWAVFAESPGKRAAVIAGVAMTITALNITCLAPRLSLRVPVEKSAPQPLLLVVRAAGTLEAKASVSLRIPFEGKVLKKFYKEGDPVAPKQQLLLVDREKIRLEYQNRKDALANAQADLANAVKELRLQKSLFSKQAVAYAAVQEAQRAVQRSEQALRQAQEAFRLESDRWNSNALYAPFAGTVVKDWIGDEIQITAGKEVLTIADISEFTIRVQVNEMDIKLIKVGQTAEARIAIHPQTVFRAVVTQIGVGGESNGINIPEVPVTLRLLDTEGLLLRPKLSAEVRILAGQTEPLLSVPREAVDNALGVPRVWQVDALNRLRPLTVTLGRSNPERLEVTEGLRAGLTICAKAGPELLSGMKVFVETPR